MLSFYRGLKASNWLSLDTVFRNLPIAWSDVSDVWSSWSSKSKSISSSYSYMSWLWNLLDFLFILRTSKSSTGWLHRLLSEDLYWFWMLARRRLSWFFVYKPYILLYFLLKGDTLFYSVCWLGTFKKILFLAALVNLDLVSESRFLDTSFILPFLT